MNGFGNIEAISWRRANLSRLDLLKDEFNLKSLIKVMGTLLLDFKITIWWKWNDSLKFQLILLLNQGDPIFVCAYYYSLELIFEFSLIEVSSKTESLDLCKKIHVLRITLGKQDCSIFLNICFQGLSISDQLSLSSRKLSLSLRSDLMKQFGV